jgi:D-3-phosphoglycerate dehydrogenase
MSNQIILVCDNFGQDFIDRLSNFGRVYQSSDINYSLPLDKITILVVRSKTKVTKELIDIMKNLECVITATHGIDHIDLDCLNEKGIVFRNIPAQSYDVAQGVIAYIMAHSTNLVQGDRSMKRGQWKKNLLVGRRVTGKTLGLIGCGKIGREVAKLGSALRMNVVVSDPCLKDNDSISVVSLDELLRTSDFISVNCPLNNCTRNLIGKKEIAKMKDGVFLVNTARGGIINEQALLEAVMSGKVGVALDVFSTKKPFEDEVVNNLIKNEHVIATPHSIGQTHEAIIEKGEGVIKAIDNYVNTKKA